VEGEVIIAGLDMDLLKFSLNGAEQWRAPLADIPVGTPALGPEGQIYVVDVKGGLTAFSPDGTQQWRFEPGGGREATSGPIVASNGTIYYTRVDSVQAISPQGESLWLRYAADGYFDYPPVLSAGESYLFLKNAALAAESGVPLDLKGLPLSLSDQGQFTDPILFVGADSRTYVRSAHEVIGWKNSEAGVVMDQPVTWDYQGSVAIFPPDAGVTPERLIWLFYSGDFGDTRVVWLDTDGRLVGNSRVPARQATMIGVDKDSVSYFCSSDFGNNPRCFALEQGSERPLWEVRIDPGFEIAGGALVPGRLYVASGAGYLIAVGEG
jgi:outer membrane protein assembly factor BamB